MYCREYRTIFVHVPKCGGTSIEAVFQRRLGVKKADRARLLLQSNGDPAKGPNRFGHLFADEYVGLGHVPAADFDAFFKFAVVRNPWDRVVSCFKYRYAERMPFPKFLRRLEEGRLDWPRFIDTQGRYVFGADGAQLVDVIIRYERLREEWPGVSRRIFGEEVPLPEKNVSEDRRDFRSFYTDDQAAMVGRIYRDDVAAFGYAFG